MLVGLMNASRRTKTKTMMIKIMPKEEKNNNNNLSMSWLVGIIRSMIGSQLSKYENRALGFGERPDSNVPKQRVIGRWQKIKHDKSRIILIKVSHFFHRRICGWLFMVVDAITINNGVWVEFGNLYAICKPLKERTV